MFSDALPFFFSVEVFVFHICGHTGGWQFGPLSVLCLPRPASQCRAVPYQCLKKHTVPPDGSSRRLRRHSTIVFAVLRCLTVCLALCGAFHCSSFCPAFCFFRLVPYFFVFCSSIFSLCVLMRTLSPGRGVLSDLSSHGLSVVWWMTSLNPVVPWIVAFFCAA